MHTPRFSRQRPSRGQLRPVLLLALAAALASCDEVAPTDSADPAARSGGTGAIPVGYTAPPLSLGGGPPFLSLPVDQQVSTANPAPAFRIIQTGTGPNGIFQINRPDNGQDALQGLSNGLGRGGFFQIQNAGNTGPALRAETNGMGSAGSFQTSNEGNYSPTLDAEQGGSGAAAHFETTTASNARSTLEVIGNHPAPALLVRQNGNGKGAVIQLNNTSSHQPALIVEQLGTGDALLAIGMSRLAGPIAVGGTAQFAIGINSHGAVTVDGGSPLSPAISVTQGISQFTGDVNVTGDLTVSGNVSKGGGSFRIDDPLDPEHKYLSHSFVESPDMMNVYNGNAVLDENGRATVELPAYFEALNRDFRYQLTPIGAPGPDLYIAEGVEQNHFRIAGGRPYAHVSWQVTGVRKDPYAEQHRIKVEEDKPAAKAALVAQR